MCTDTCVLQFALCGGGSVVFLHVCLCMCACICNTVAEVHM